MKFHITKNKNVKYKKVVIFKRIQKKNKKKTYYL